MLNLSPFAGVDKEWEGCYTHLSAPLYVGLRQSINGNPSLCCLQKPRPPGFSMVEQFIACSTIMHAPPSSMHMH